MRHVHNRCVLLTAMALVLAGLPACQSGGREPGSRVQVQQLRAENESLRARLAEAEPAARSLTAAQNAGLDRLQAICVAAHKHSQEEGRMPRSAEDLHGRYVPVDAMSAPDGEPYWLDFAPMDTFDSHRIVGYDRGAVARNEYAAVLFADCHVELLAPLRFRRMTEEPPNAGVDFRLPPQPALPAR
jgi:hypothetical protein